MSIDPRNQLPGVVVSTRDQYGTSWGEATRFALFWQGLPCIFMFLTVALLLHGGYWSPYLVSLVYLLAFFIIPPAAAIRHRSLQVGIIALCLPLIANGIPTVIWALYINLGWVLYHLP